MPRQALVTFDLHIKFEVPSIISVPKIEQGAQKFKNVT